MSYSKSRYGGYPSNWEEIKKRVLERDNYRCQECGDGDLELHVHHIKPISEGGSHNLSNLITLCKFCHRGKHPQKYYLNKAIEENRIVMMTYTNKDGYTSKKRLAPYYLEYYRSMEFLVGYDFINEETRYYLPKRVNYVEMTDQRFTPPNFNIERFIDNNFQFNRKRPRRTPVKPKSKSDISCFIATAVFGTPYASEINILRDFRDETLLKRSFGKFLVDMYYRYSPPIAKIISENNKVRKIVRDYFVSPLVKLMKKLGLS